MYENLAILGIFIFLYSISSGGLSKTPFSGAIVFSVFGLAFGPMGLDLLKLNIDAHGLGTLAELSLAFVLFTDASNANLHILKKNYSVPQRLLLIGLPLTILLGFVVGYFIFDTLTVIEIAILATILAPTDAALGKAVVSDKNVPATIREVLNVESGLNDGICVPILFAFLAFANHTGNGRPILLIIKLVIEEIGIGVVVGAGLSIIAVWLINKFDKLGWITEIWRQIPVVSLAIACFALAQAFGGSGFIASFVGGLVFDGTEKNHKHKLLMATEGTGDIFVLLTWVIFGAEVVGKAITYFSWNALLYAVLSLTVIRMLPVFVTLAGMKMKTYEKLFVGWFGPRGLASVVFTVIVFNSHLEGGGIIAITAVFTIILSVIAHGLSANPLVTNLASRLKCLETTSK